MSRFHIVGSQAAYFTRYYVKSDGTLCNYSTAFYFKQFFVEPFSHCIFSSLNLLAQSLRWVMNHLKESNVCVKTCHMLFSGESFLYFAQKSPVRSQLRLFMMRHQFVIVITCNCMLELKASPKPISESYVDNQCLSFAMFGCICWTKNNLSPSNNKKTKLKYCTMNGAMKTNQHNCSTSEGVSLLIFG